MTAIKRDYVKSKVASCTIVKENIGELETDQYICLRSFLRT